MNHNQTAVLAGGCFWCLEALFVKLKGVEAVESGYSGGQAPDPTYDQVCRGGTGHAEAVKIVLDPEIISYLELLMIFFTVHDPTTLNRQGVDMGEQYRSEIFYLDEDQKATARQAIREISISGIWERPIVTALSKFMHFFKAEDYHQQFFARNPDQPYCMVVVAPKVARFRARFMNRLKTQ